ncbi:hypothetical protein BDR04DRAFT_1157200 [Suillus decipiens]|nr:hypothetical protein BDR04DRAFT_1157200 [Suillus decipiens]
MSSNTVTSAAANQALIALLDMLNELVEQVLQSQSEEEKMRLSLNIASQLNYAICSYRTVATYIPLHLLSIAAEIHRAQRGTVHLVQILDWNCVGHNDDICRGHPLYPKTLASAPVAIPTAGPSLPVPAPAPIPEPAPAPIPAPALAPARSVMIRIPQGVTTGTIAGPSKSHKHQFSASPPRPVKRARKTAPKSKQILIDTNSNGDTNKVTDEFKPDDEYEYEDDDEDDSQPMGQSKASTHQTGADKVKDKGKHPQPKPIGLVLLPCERCTLMKVDCKPWMNKRGSIAHTCTLCNKWRMKCIWPEQPDTLTTPTGPTPTPIPPVAPITTHSKTTRKGKTGKNSKGTDINTPRPAPIPEELAVDIKMLDDPPAGTSTGLPDTAPHAAPLASADDVPPDHWIEPMDDSTLPPAPFVDTLGDVRYSPIYPSHTHRPPSPITTSITLQSHQHPWPLTNVEMEAMLAQIQIDMQELRTRDDITNWVPREDWWITWPFR